MIYICEQTGCHFAFDRETAPDQCPECGGTHIHPAKPTEALRFHEERRQSDLTPYCVLADCKI